MGQPFLSSDVFDFSILASGVGVDVRTFASEPLLAPRILSIERVRNGFQGSNSKNITSCIQLLFLLEYGTDTECG